MAKSPSLHWLKDRSTGVLLHPTSLHGDQGIGVLGNEAREFITFLAGAGIRYWQVLPLGPTGYGDSPYSSFSAFAGNPYLIDFQPLLESGILQDEELDVLRHLARDHVDFGALYRIKWPLLRLAHKRFLEQKRAYLPNHGLFAEFRESEARWLEPFSAFMALKERFSGHNWREWPEECRSLESARKSRYWKETAHARDGHAFFQYLFTGQWNQLRAFANEAGVEIIGDAPIFVAMDSADVWASPEWFELDSAGRPTHVAGVPPDYFSKTGQLWGNPLYNWNALEADGFTWWVERLKANFRLFDVVRLDHFRGFYNYWRIPAGAKDARSGQWEFGPQQHLFKAVADHIPDARLIAEDLGEIDDAVRVFRDRLGLPGMAILQFAFDGQSDNLYLPHNLEPHSVVYPGTHDNNTALGWYLEAGEASRDQFRRYLRVDGHDVSWDLVRMAMGSVSRLAVLQMQDLLELDAGARMNQPGTEQGNWQWRMEDKAFHRLHPIAGYLQELKWLFSR